MRIRPAGRKPVMYQRWQDLLFLHWSYDPVAIQSTLPRGLTVDTFEGKAYIGIVPFFMREVRPAFGPRVPWISDFLELNVRTYVYDEHGMPGVWFYSLNANQWLAVRAARRFFSLPYFDCRMKADKNATTAEIRYLSHRRGTDEDLSSCFHYRSYGPTRLAKPGTLEFFLVERYILFAQPTGHVRPGSGRVHHQPYPLLDVEVTESDDAAFELDRLTRPGRGVDHAVMSPGVTVEVFAIQK
ncbi:MAG: YqjF family protein [Terriglobia bacterium]